MVKEKGIDISYHQGAVDFNKVVADGIKFAIFREGYRKTIDKKFLEYVEQARKAGLRIAGVYHFSYALNAVEAKEEAESCIANIKKAGLSKNEIVVFFDFEYDTVTQAKKSGVTLTKVNCNTHAKIFCETIESYGYRAGIYSNKDYYKNWFDHDLLSRYVFWLADYSGDPDYPCEYQQYSSTGKVSGISTDVDMNYWFTDTASASTSVPKKDLNTIAQEVIDGLWDNGDKRKQLLTAAGYSYEEVQRLVNKMLKSSGSSTNKQYKCIGDVYLRSGPGTNYSELSVIKKDTIIESSESVKGSSVNWLRTTVNGKTGYTSDKYFNPIN